MIIIANILHLTLMNISSTTQMHKIKLAISLLAFILTINLFFWIFWITFNTISQKVIKFYFLKNMFKKVNVKEKLISFSGGATTETELESGDPWVSREGVRDREPGVTGVTGRHTGQWTPQIMNSNTSTSPGASRLYRVSANTV